VLKNFPSEPELRSAVQPLGDEVRFTRWQYYWALSYLSTGPPLTAGS
jgi:hypothetical protein